MNNFAHDIPLPDDPAIRKFLWISYFHDAVIQEIHPGKPTYKDLTLRIHSGHDGFTYLLRFHGVAHFSCSKDNFSWHTGIDIASTVFKDTALLHRLEREAEKSLYHLRFSFWDGYMDIIFAKFTIRREGGRVSNKPEYDPAMVNWGAYRYAPNGYYLKHDPFLADIAHPEGEDDAERQEWIDDILWARLYHIHQAGDVQAVISQARSYLTNEPKHDHAELYAAYLLGKYGDQSDLPALTRHFLHTETAIRQRVFLDAMELIQERME